MATSTRKRKSTADRKHARDYAPFKSVSAHVILRADGTHIATVQAYFGEGNVVVTIYNHGAENPTAEDTELCCQTSSAGGYGYDRLTAALDGMIIDGHRLCNHCGEQIDLLPGQRYFAKSSTAPKGYRYANWYSVGEGADKKYLGYTHCYKESGLDYLRALGYQVIQAC